MPQPKLTEWYPSTIKPVRDGVYRAQDFTMRCNCCWIELEFRNGEWFSSLYSPPGMFKCHFFENNLKRWRGLANDPSFPALVCPWCEINDLKFMRVLHDAPNGPGSITNQGIIMTCAGYEFPACPDATGTFRTKREAYNCAKKMTKM